MDWFKTPSDTRKGWFAGRLEAANRITRKQFTSVQVFTGQGICLRDGSAAHPSSLINLHSEQREVCSADTIGTNKSFLAQDGNKKKNSSCEYLFLVQM